METDFTPFDWERISFGLQPPMYLLEVALKCVVVFCILMLVMRLIGKRGQNNLSPMQQMLMIALGSAAGDALLYPTVPLLYAALILVGITLLNMGLDALTVRWAPVRRQVESHPRLLVDNGVVNQQALRAERTNIRELNAALRINGARSLAQVQYAILEVTGEISVFLHLDVPGGEEELLRHVVEHEQGLSRT